MRHLPAALATFAYLACAAHAETPLSGPAFDAETRGQTITFASDGDVYGTETYLENGQTIWQSTDGPCISGAWTEKGEALCFTYAGDPVPTCWRFFSDKGKLRGILDDTSGTLTLITEVSRADTPPACSPASVLE